MLLSLHSHITRLFCRCQRHADAASYITSMLMAPLRAPQLFLRYGYVTLDAAVMPRAGRPLCFFVDAATLPRRRFHAHTRGYATPRRHALMLYMLTLMPLRALLLMLRYDKAATALIRDMPPHAVTLPCHFADADNIAAIQFTHAVLLTLRCH